MLYNILNDVLVHVFQYRIKVVIGGRREGGHIAGHLHLFSTVYSVIEISSTSRVLSLLS